MRGSIRDRVAGLAEAWSRITRLGVPVVVLKDNPQDRQDQDPTHDPNFCLAQLADGADTSPCDLDRAERLDRWFDSLSAAADRAGAEVLDLTPYYCDAQTCPAVIGGVNVYFDNNHLTVTYAKTLAPYLYRALRDQGLPTAGPAYFKKP